MLLVQALAQESWSILRTNEVKDLLSSRDILQLCPVSSSSLVLPGGEAPSLMVVATTATEKARVQRMHSFSK